MNSSNNNSDEQYENSDNNNNIQETHSCESKLHEQYELTEEDILHFKETFDLFDTDGKGTIDIEQVKQIITNYLTNDIDNNNNININQSNNKTFLNIIKNIPNKNSNGISFNDFLILISEQITKADSKDDIFTLYTLLFGEEYNSDTFRRQIKEINANISDQEINEMIMRGDVSGNGKVSFDDFYNILTKDIE